MKFRLNGISIKARVSKLYKIIISEINKEINFIEILKSKSKNGKLQLRTKKSCLKVIVIIGFFKLKIFIILKGLT